ncbi:MAG: hypothetical protein Q8O27_01610 [Enterobacteriaceae bacterium]|nr:hypothetical protein [Enterobacteriaceae bacterium]
MNQEIKNEFTDRKLIIDDILMHRKQIEICPKYSISREQLSQIIKEIFTPWELIDFKETRSYRRGLDRKEKYHRLYHTDKDYCAKKRKMARIRYYICKNNLKNNKYA